ncbi:hypothetical protein L218DRAFT_886678, partial [Marasmius fiardii PR-910]
ILGRAIKNEYLALSVLGTAFGGAFLATRGSSSKKAEPPSTIEKIKEAIPINAGTSEEEQFIKNFIAEAEKVDAAGGSKH